MDFARLVMILVVCLWPCATNDSHAKKSSSKTINGWLIRQTSNEGGPVLSEITNNAIRISLSKYRWVFIAKAPAWNILFLNDRTKNFVELSNEQWKKKFLTLQGGKSQRLSSKLDLVSRSTGAKAKIANLKAFEYVVEREKSSQNSTAKEKIAEIWTSPDIKAPPPVADIVCQLTRLPHCKGIPLKANLRANGRMVSVLETIDAKPHSFLASNFEPARDWLQVRDQIKVMFGDAADNLTTDFIDADRTEMKPVPPRKLVQ